MKRLVKISVGVLAVLIAIQFIQPAGNKNPEVLPTDIVNTIPVPVNVLSVLKKACYDCHSNNTNYAWFDNIQPARWFVENHIRQGKENLNFSEFGSYSTRKQMNKIKAISNSIKDESMPLSSYAMIHSTAKLTKEDRTLIVAWADQLIDSLSERK